MVKITGKVFTNRLDSDILYIALFFTLNNGRRLKTNETHKDSERRGNSAVS